MPDRGTNDRVVLMTGSYDSVEHGLTLVIEQVCRGVREEFFVVMKRHKEMSRGASELVDKEGIL